MAVLGLERSPWTNTLVAAARTKENILCLGAGDLYLDAITINFDVGEKWNSLTIEILLTFCCNYLQAI